MAQRSTQRCSVRHLAGRGWTLKGGLLHQFAEGWEVFVVEGVRIGSHPPSACASRLSTRSATQQWQPFFTSMLILPASPALVLPPQHTTTKDRALPQLSLMEHVESSVVQSETRRAFLNRSILWRESDDYHVCGIEFKLHVTHLTPRLTLSHEYVLPSLSLYITAWWLCPPHTIQLKRAKWSGHSFAFAPICWSVVALFRMHWSVLWRGRDVPRRHWWGELTQKYTIQLGGESAGAALTRCADAVAMRPSFPGSLKQKHLCDMSSMKNGPRLYRTLQRNTEKHNSMLEC